MPTATKRRASTQALVRELADLTLPETPDLFETLWNDSRAASQFDALCEQIRIEREFEGTEEGLARFERLSGALPEDLRGEFTKHDDSLADTAEVHARAGFLIGLAIGRRMGGAR